MEKFKIKKTSSGYRYLHYSGEIVVGMNSEGKMWGVTKYFKDFKRLVNEEV